MNLKDGSGHPSPVLRAERGGRGSASLGSVGALWGYIVSAGGSVRSSFSQALGCVRKTEAPTGCSQLSGWRQSFKERPAPLFTDRRLRHEKMN